MPPRGMEREDGEPIHTPVLLEEVIRYLKPTAGNRYVDATAGGGGHAIAIIEAIGAARPDERAGFLLALEWDETLFPALARHIGNVCGSSNKHCVLRRTNYAAIADVVRSLGFGPVAGVIFDFGMSSYQLEASKRGFSFRSDEKLDMRYSRKDLSETAADILARQSAREIERMLKEFGEESFAPAIAREIARTRVSRPIVTTQELVAAIERATPSWYRRRRIHCATKTFQALRIAVNHEFENIPRGLAGAAAVLEPNGGIVTIAFHYREDALIKQFFREPENRAQFRPVTLRPIRASARERIRNPRSRSAILRAYQKLP